MRCVHASALAAPFVIAVAAHAVLASSVWHGYAAFSFFEDGGELTFAVFITFRARFICSILLDIRYPIFQQGSYGILFRVKRLNGFRTMV